VYTFLWLLAPVAILCAFSLLTLIVTFREKNCVWELDSLNESPVAEPELPRSSDANPYRSPASPASELPVTKFATEKCLELEMLEYQYLGSFRHVKKGIYQIRYEAWISSDRYVMAWIESGSLMAIPQSNLSMFTLGNRNADSDTPQSVGSPICVESLTAEAAFFPNVGGMRDTMLFPSASARDADQLHRQRLAFVSPHQFTEDPLGDYHRFRAREAQVGHERGICRFVNPRQDVWLPTFVGALRVFIQENWFLLSRHVYSDRRRLKRMVKRRVT
jgi:hypothetical protein